MGTWPLGIELLSFCYDCLRCDDFSLVRFWAGRPSPFTLAFDNSANTSVAIFAESTLYRAAVRQKFESFARSCLGLLPGQTSRKQERKPQENDGGLRRS